MLNAIWTSGLARRPPLDMDALLGSVAGAGTLPDRSGWRSRLAILCEELERSARLTPLGRTLAFGQLAAALRHRLWLERLWTKRPEVLAQPLAPPIVIVGQMRSGSTRLQRLLACDPRLSATRFFESWNPVPRAADRPLVDGRPWRARLTLALSHVLNPAFPAIHPTAWDAPDEEIGWHNISFFGAAFETQWRVPRFTATVEQNDPIPVYREFRRLLQTVAWFRRDDGSRPWILKIPQFTQDLDALMTVFPDARIVRLHRDPCAVVASSASLVRNQMEVQSDTVCLRWLGRETLRKVVLRHARTETALARVPVVAVDFATMDADWQGEMTRVYAYLRLPFAPQVRAKMVEELRRAERHGLDRHRYKLSDYGLTPTQVHDAMALPQPEVIAAE